MQVSKYYNEQLLVVLASIMLESNITITMTITITIVNKKSAPSMVLLGGKVDMLELVLILAMSMAVLVVLLWAGTTTVVTRTSQKKW